jgi:hypothetical protein
MLCEISSKLFTQAFGCDYTESSMAVGTGFGQLFRGLGEVYGIM